jgi:hypothetical protein
MVKIRLDDKKEIDWINNTAKKDTAAKQGFLP